MPLRLLMKTCEQEAKGSSASIAQGEVAQIYGAVARQVAIKIAAKSKDFSSKFPSIKISKDT